MPEDSIRTHTTTSIEDMIAFHEEMESYAMQAGDFTKAGHHRKMQEIYSAMKESVPTSGS